MTVHTEVPNQWFPGVEVGEGSGYIVTAQGRVLAMMELFYIVAVVVIIQPCVFAKTYNYTQKRQILLYADFPGVTVVKNPPANAGDTGSIPGPGRSHVPQSN